MTQSILVKPHRAGFDNSVQQSLADVSSALLADADSRVACLGTPIRPFGGKLSFVGTAVTIGSGSMAQWKSLDLSKPGQVLVIASGGRRDRAEFGAIFVELARRRGVAAIVTDGLLRDSAEIGRMNLAVFACGTHPFSPRDDTQGRIGMPEALLGVTINTGDLLVGDDDGIAVIPAAVASAVRAIVPKQHQREARLLEALETPGGLLPERIVDALAAIPIIES
ncbi:RraA family protein [Agrobacterium sp. NPDC089420]|uniref:RraA family protein n=1 Tax=Agrobacterium sp. NPDC089420 TaxID=3363918 RepID=UPI00384AA12B